MLSRTSIGLSVLLLATALAACGDDETPAVDAGVTVDSNPGIDAGDVTATCFDEAAFFKAADTNNVFGTDPGIDIAAATPNFAPAADAPVLTGGATPPTDDAFFDATATFIGAVGTEDWTADWTAYPVDTAANGGDTIVDVEAGDITEDTTWSADNTYVLKGQVFVTGATLTIEAGTVIRGESGSVLVIALDGDIAAEGTAAEPIVFTSSRDTGAAAGDWGGVVLIGDATTNLEGGTGTVEGFESALDAKVTYGGTDDSGSCGSMEYVRIEYAGFELAADDELNGLTVAGCGSGTVLDFIQVHRSLDDGIAFFGGTAGIKHAVVTLAADDGFDWDYGWRGKGQFLISMQDATTGDKGFEGNNNTAMPKAGPVSNPGLWNITLLGSTDAPAADNRGGMHLRDGTCGTFRNVIVAYSKSFAVDVDSYASVERAEAGLLTVENSYFYQNAGGTDWPADFDTNSAGVENDCMP